MTKILKGKGHDGFSRQSGYGAFSVRQSAKESVFSYIAEEAIHHRRMNFQDELRALLNKLNSQLLMPSPESTKDPSSAILTALKFAAQKHSRQRRKDSEATPYINHPIAVAELLSRVGRITDLPTLQAAILHDTMEDTESPLKQAWTFRCGGLMSFRLNASVDDSKGFGGSAVNGAKIGMFGDGSSP